MYISTQKRYVSTQKVMDNVLPFYLFTRIIDYDKYVYRNLFGNNLKLSNGKVIERHRNASVSDD